MYRQQFGLSRHPFGPEIEPDDLFVSAGAREAQTRIGHLLEMRGIGLVTGESGSGKTCSCRRTVATLHPGRYRLVYVALSTGNVMDLFKTIAWEMGLPTERSRAALHKQIRAEVTRLSCEVRARPVLIVDEAQNLTPHEVKTIISRAGDGTKVVLTGDPYQIDNPYLDSSSNGLNYVIEKFKDHSLFGHIILHKSERSDLSALASGLL